ncbi:unnamed protein product [Owenia fusiformis]|uniref:Uncharacterized protein n=1 Tax=Owenia fusiformis TaxID=6347 RepID=A0A8J1TZX2_OWEFU|nr:unnamed protein product [Owenia fusiformis]
MCPTATKTTVIDNTKEAKAAEAGETEEEVDHWAIVTDIDTGKPWSDMTTKEKTKRITINILKGILVLGLLYMFICSINLLSSAFRLIAGRVAGSVFRSNAVLSNPVAGLMIGILATVLVQSSSTSTSITVAMVSSGILDVRTAIPIIMGSNIGTSVTNTLVAMAQSGDRNEFRRAFGGATIHDMFNWLSVIILLPLELATRYLERLTGLVIKSMNLQGGAAKVNFLKVITVPFTDLIVQLDSKVIEAIARGDEEGASKPMLKQWCRERTIGNETRQHNYTTGEANVNTTIFNLTSAGYDYRKIDNDDGTRTFLYNITSPLIERTPCQYLFRWTNLSEGAVGAILLVMSLVILCTCLIAMVKVLNSLLKGQMANIIKKIINTDFPGKAAFLTGYVAILLGAGLTVLVQSSSIFTSTITPLVGMGIISLDRMFPLTLGSNIGTTVTSILAAFAATGNKLENSLQIAFCHLFFNISGIIIFYPVPFMRKAPINLAKNLGNITADYRWFAVVYLIFMFLIIPGGIFGLSIAGWEWLVGIAAPLIIILLIVLVINLFQHKWPKYLPAVLKTWDFLPLPLRSLKPYDYLITRFCLCCKCCKPRVEEETDSEADSIELAKKEALAMDALSEPPCYDNIAFENETSVTPSQIPYSSDTSVFTAALSSKKTDVTRF